MNEHPDYLARLIARRVSSTRISSLMGPQTGAAQGSTSLGGASSPVSTDITKVEIRDTDPTGTALVGGRIWGSGGLLSRWGQGVRWGTSRRWGSQKSTLKWYDGSATRQIAMFDEIPSVAMVGAKAKAVVSQSIANGTWTILAFAAEDFDTHALHDLATNNSRLTVPAGQAGYYLVMAHVEWDTNATGIRAIAIRLNGSGYRAINMGSASSAFNTRNHTATVLYLAVADYVEADVFQNSGAALNTNTSPADGTLHWLSATRLGS